MILGQPYEYLRWLPPVTTSGDYLRWLPPMKRYLILINLLSVQNYKFLNKITESFKKFISIFKKHN